LRLILFPNKKTFNAVIKLSDTGRLFFAIGNYANITTYASHVIKHSASTHNELA